VVECPAVMQAVAESGTVLVTIAMAMVVMVSREFEMTARARGWRMPKVVLRRAPRFCALPIAWRAGL
jgi:ABC-type dipeptide/oligopeptide/nickel transport system permease component